MYYCLLCIICTKQVVGISQLFLYLLVEPIIEIIMKNKCKQVPTLCIENYFSNEILEFQ